MTLVKICGLTCYEDAAAALEMGADLLGFVFSESPRKADPDCVREILRSLPDAKSVGVFTEESEDVMRLVDYIGLDFAQLHGGQSEEFASRLGAERVIRAVRVRDERSVLEIGCYSHAAAILLDAFDKHKPGGTGKTFDWALAKMARGFAKPVILSGGLNPNNVAAAVKAVQPWAVDTSSGIEAAPGRKDHKKLKEFIENVRKADGRT